LAGGGWLGEAHQLGAQCIDLRLHTLDHSLFIRHLVHLQAALRVVW
jgi:hypothetical protein